MSRGMYSLFLLPFCSFLCTNPRLSPAWALLFPNVFVPLGKQKKLKMTKVHFRSYIHKKMILFPQRIDKDIAEDDPVRLLDALDDKACDHWAYKACRHYPT